MSPLALGGLLALILLNAFFVAAEFSLVRARTHRLEQMEEEGSKRARRARLQVEEIGRYLSACQVGITLASIGIGFLGEPTLGHFFQSVFHGALSPGLSVVLSVLCAYLVVTVLHVVFGEQAPKMFALSRAESTASRLSGAVHLTMLLLRPMVLLLDRMTNLVLRPLGVNSADHSHELQNGEELRASIIASASGGTLDRGEATMLSGVFSMHQQEARHAMTPRPKLTMVRASDPVSAALEMVISSGHTRILAVDDDKSDVVVGVAHVAELLRVRSERGEEGLVSHALREAFIVPESRALDELLTDMRRQRTSMAVVADEYGRAVGVVTVEDIVEEIVGEIDDETDQPEEERSVRPLPEGDGFLVDGHVSMNELRDHGIHLPDDTSTYSSVAGLVFDRLGHLPEVGESLAVDGWNVEVSGLEDRRISLLTLRRRAG